MPIDAVCCSNPHSQPIQVWCEPWGMPLPLLPGESFRIVARSRFAKALETQFEGDDVIVFAWPGATMKVDRDQRLVHDFPTEVPGIPPGMSLQGFLGLMLG